ncbi:MAG: type II toxin-antitoxin system VapC family toxin [Proteobacteria bacterium]|nr:type II toxin-antitoxin system VapC family toxin [Pseudomonadota bacterium]MYJ95102.1 type II toxin-antitoxin system VapC family toxin [Pseudomonadota bacterium]
MTEFVLDCSVAIAWVFDDQASDATDTLLRELKDGGRAVVPPLLHLELGNVLVQAERRRKLTAAETSQRLDFFADLPIATDSAMEADLRSGIVQLARRTSLTTYDASYLELALRRGLALATRDKALRSAARKEAIAVLPSP